MGLNNLGLRLATAGNIAASEEAFLESIALLRRMCEESATDDSQLAMTLSNLSALWLDCGRLDDALKVAEEAVAIRRRLAGDHPLAFSYPLAVSLNNLSAILDQMGRAQESRTAIEETVGIFREVAAREPQSGLPRLAVAPRNLAYSWSSADRHTEAEKASAEAIQALSGLFCTYPAGLKAEMKALLTQYWSSCRANGALPDESMLRPILDCWKRSFPNEQK